MADHVETVEDRPCPESRSSPVPAPVVPSRDELLAYVRAQPGSAPIKVDYIDFSKVKEKFARNSQQRSTEANHGKTKGICEGSGDEPPTKKQRVRGQNKHRPRDKHTLPSERPCLDVLRGGSCQYGDQCKYSHDIKKLMDNKLPDVGPRCFIFDQFGACPFGLLCRFGSSHIDAEFKSIIDDEKVKQTGGKQIVLNVLSRNLQIQLRKKKYDFKKYEQYMKSLKTSKPSNRTSNVKGGSNSCDNVSTVCPPENKQSAVAGKLDSPLISEVVQSVPTSLASTGGAASSLGDDANDTHGVTVLSNEVTGQSCGKTLTADEVIQVDKGNNTSSYSGEKAENSSMGVPNIPAMEDAKPTTAGRASQPEEQKLRVGENGSVNQASVPNDLAGKVTIATENAARHAGAVTDADIIKLRPCEKKSLDVEDKLLLAPLTTVGNLPFRKVCKQLGADITCGEMAMCTNLLQGQTSEWALLKRHPSEDIFGVQLCGGYPDTMTKCAELLSNTIDIDFIDVNVGCPIDLVYHKGAGSGLMNRMGKFQEIVRGMSSVLDIPLTVKMRTGIQEGKLVAHKVIPQVLNWGASVVTVHGRTREQRYTKQADWSYLRQCAEAAAPYPFIGNGDILSYEDANFFREQSGSSGLMIARGALIKPWVFTEIKEQRHWDISSRERLDLLQDYVNMGLTHWGSDTEGVRKTRRFLLEWLSFLHRYIPVGLLETLPQRINQRPPYFVGRDDLETLMASANCADWLKISEMFLGPVPDDFQFLPKHKANAYK
ncbi:tRNA-dihydrouridine(47) synthase [NAD(P)(+)]-like [Diadema setosum]|uniref:tRNA-dihydrouridine(47) synthase [NAD(P)(+)]-like n=1 Tax=Diadema setosum TaxID=31175 RepID=UPI003B3B2749